MSQTESESKNSLKVKLSKPSELAIIHTVSTLSNGYETSNM